MLEPSDFTDPAATGAGVPSSSANPDGRAAVIVQHSRRRRLRAHARRMLVVSMGVLAVGALVSVYFSFVGTRDCWPEQGGERCVERAWYPLTFQLASELETLNGVSDGVRREWYRNGELWYQGSYDNGKRVGKRYEFWPDGSARFVGGYDRDVLHGTESWWYDNGQMEWQVYRQRGERHGQEISWYPSGARKRVGHFMHGDRHGEFEHYLTDGSHAFSSRYARGVRMDAEEG